MDEPAIDLNTDQNRIILMLAKAGVPYEVYPADEDCDEAQIHVTCKGRTDQKVRGYLGFISCFYFDKDGNFITMGCWE